MSLPWNESLWLQIGPGAVSGSLHAGWLARKVLARASQAVVPGQSRGGALDAVLSELKAASPGRGRDLRVQLAHTGVHLDVVSGDYRNASDRQLQAIATACVNEVLPDQVAPPVVRWQLQPDLRHLLIAALDGGDVDAVVQAAAQHHLRLVSLQPGFCALWNQHAQRLPGGTGVLATIDGDQAVVALARNGTLVALSSGICTERESRAGSAPEPHKNALDERTDRLLSSVGQAPDALTAFVLVSSGPATAQATPRWQVLGLQEEGS